MRANEIIKLLAEGEGYTVEFKACVNAISKSTYETVCAFSNRYGGHLLLGVDDSGNVLGVNPRAIATMKKNFINVLNNPEKISPSLYLNLEEIKLDGKTILYTYVPISSLVQTCDGKLFDRIGDADVDITKQVARAANIYAIKLGLFTERKLFPHITTARLRLKELMPRVRLLVEMRSNEHPWLRMSDSEILRSANLLEVDPATSKEVLNLAAILLFGSDETITACCPGYMTDCLKRVVNTERYDDRKIVITNLLDSFGEIMGFIQKHTPDPFYMEEHHTVSLRDKIFREVVSNSLCHREFSSNMVARVIIKGDHLYADNWNRSNLHGALDPTTIAPRPKNPIIAKFFVNIGYAETLGSGMRNLSKYLPRYVHGAQPQLIEGEVLKP